jgi:hypothetical protein
MKKIFAIILLSLCVQLHAQETSRKTNRYAFHSYNNFGLIEGEKGTSVLIESVNGFNYANWFAGIGIGIDHYTFRSIPVYLDIKREWSDKLPVFLFASAGRNCPWVKQTDDRYQNKFYPRSFYEGGLGYRFSINQKNNMVFSVSYSEKNLHEKIIESISCPFIGPCTQSYRNFEHRLTTLVVKAGVRF